MLNVSACYKVFSDLLVACLSLSLFPSFFLPPSFSVIEQSLFPTEKSGILKN